VDDQITKAKEAVAADLPEDGAPSRDDVVKMMAQSMRVRYYPSKDLRLECEPVKEDEFTDELKMLIEAMSTVMLHYGGIGISAPQCGIPLRVIIVNLTGKSEDNIAIVNPRVIEAAEEHVTFGESCLSFPGVKVQVSRSAAIKIQAESFAGKTIDLDLKGLGALAVQHEMDHLDGKLLIDYATPTKRAMIERKLRKLHRRTSQKAKARAGLPRKKRSKRSKQKKG